MDASRRSVLSLPRAIWVVGCLYPLRIQTLLEAETLTSEVLWQIMPIGDIIIMTTWPARILQTRSLLLMKSENKKMTSPFKYIYRWELFGGLGQGFMKICRILDTSKGECLDGMGFPNVIRGVKWLILIQLKKIYG